MIYSIFEQIYADGKEVGISVSEDDCDTPELYVFSSDDINSSLNKEKEAPELKKYIFQCSLCTYSTKIKAHLNQHQLVHSDVKLFSCSQCSYKCKRKNNLKNHALRHSSSSSTLLECVKCNFRTTFSNQFKKHMLQHSSVDKLDCEDDDNSENNKSYVDKLPNSKNGTNLFICSKCDYKTKYESILARHVLKRHTNIQPLHCSECDFVTNEKNELECHLLECSERDFDIVSKKCLNIQTLEQSSEDKLDLEEDGIDNQESNTKNIKKHGIDNQESNKKNIKKLFKCSKCKYETKYGFNLTRHVSKKHPDVEPSDEDELDYEEVGIDNQESNTKNIKKLFKCSKCDLETKYKKSLVRHMSKKHPDGKPSHRSENDFVTNEKNKLKCPEANFITIPTMLEHSSEDKLDCEENGIENQENDEDKLSNTKDIKKLFRCLKCDFETKYKKSLDRHMSSQKHLDKPSLHCTKCEFTTNDKNKLECHVLSHCGTKLLNSSSCDFKTEFAETFDAHLESNHIGNSDEDSQSCDDSKPATDDSQHLDTPSGEEDLMWHECPVCEFRTKRVHYLNHHMRNHSFSRYKCEFCNYKTNTKASFTTHLNTHEAPISFSNSEEEVNKTLLECSDCSFKTKRKSAFVSHVSQHTNKTFLNCFECDFQTPNEDELDSHIQSHTKTKKENVKRYIPNLQSEKKEIKTPRLKRVKLEQILPNENNVVEEEEPNSEIRWYHCPNCDFKANNKRFLDSHLRTHFGKKSVHECSICSYRTVSKQNLKVHMFKHSNFNLKI
ncbi:UNVERIFIED_CONTAM: hypothetical protein RMT77_018036 [Armadillidium vulgare]